MFVSKRSIFRACKLGPVSDVKLSKLDRFSLQPGKLFFEKEKHNGHHADHSQTEGSPI